MRPQPGIYHKMVQEEVNRIQPDIRRISQAIHAHPEIGLQEHRACRLLVDEARANGLG